MAAPFGVSILDLAKATQLAREIYLKCYTEDQGASRKYQELVDYIKALTNSLQQLQEAFRKYEKQYPRREWRNDPYNTDAVESVWPQLTGDFHQTLKECDSLLSRHGHLQNGRTTASSNLRWWLSAEGAVDNLMAKLKFHITKVDFYAKSVEFEAFVKNGNQIQQIRRQLDHLERLMTNGPGGSSPTLWESIISIDLKAKLEAELLACPPGWLKDGSAWPLEEGFKALAFHFARGTIHFNPTTQSGKIPELQQYLNLSKSIWILEKLKESHRFKATSTESIWADYMRELEDDLRGQVHRFEIGELGKLPAQNLLVLPSDAYAISQGEEVNPDPLDAGRAGPNEEKILEIDLSATTGNRECALLVFRESDADFRLVTSMRQADTPVALYDKEVELNMARNRLVPAYGSPAQSLSPRYSLHLLNEKGKKAREFVFESPKDVQKLQRALTGYRVHHDMSVARWCISGSKEPGNYGQGRLQLWQFKPLPVLLDSNSSEGSDSSSLLRSPTSNSQNGSPVDFLDWKPVPSTPFTDAFREYPSSRTPSLAELQNVEAQEIRRRMTVLSSTTIKSGNETPTTGRILSKASSFTSTSKSGSRETRRDFSIASGETVTSRTSVMSPVQGPRGRGTEFVKPELPVLILFTECNARYTFLHLTLDPKIHINPTACKCRKEKSGCKRVVIESKNPRFTMRVLTADQKGEDGINSWDLSVFRYPRSEKWQQAIVNDRVKTLELEFATAEERILFVDELTSLENVRTADHNDYQKDLKEKTAKKERGRTPVTFNPEAMAYTPNPDLKIASREDDPKRHGVQGYVQRPSFNMRTPINIGSPPPISTAQADFKDDEYVVDPGDAKMEFDKGSTQSSEQYKQDPTSMLITDDSEHRPDEYILNPVLHYSKLENMQEIIEKKSELFKSRGNLYPHLSQLSALDYDQLSKFETYFRSKSARVLDSSKLQSFLRSYLIISQVLECFDLLSKNNFCHGHFNILTQVDFEPIAQVVRISRCDVVKLKEAVEVAIQDQIGYEKPADEHKVSNVCHSILGSLGFLKQSRSLSEDSALLCRVVALVLDVGLVSYVGSHGSRFDVACTGKERHDFLIAINLGSSHDIRCVRKALACLDGFLNGQKVWVFQISDSSVDWPLFAGRSEKPLSVKALMEDFADIWGPVWEEAVEERNSRRILQYHLSSGVIRRVEHDDSFSAVNAVKCHWFDPESTSSLNERKPSPISTEMTLEKDDVLLIGHGRGFRKNSLCSHTYQMYEEKHSGDMTPLGTRPAGWVFKERAVGFSASQYVGITMMGTQKKLPQVTLKRHIWNRWKLQPETAPPSTLRMLLGVEVSHCTGNARRVRLMDLVLREPILSLLRLHFPGWEHTTYGIKFLEALSHDTLEAFWRDHATWKVRVAKIVCFVLEILENTGLVGEMFRAAFLNGGREQAVKINPQKHNWTQLLCDSHVTAVYAVIIEECLELSAALPEVVTCKLPQAFTALETQIVIPNGAESFDSIWLARQDKEGRQICFDIAKCEDNQSVILAQSGFRSQIIGLLRRESPTAWELRSTEDQAPAKYRAYVRASSRGEELVFVNAHEEQVETVSVAASHGPLAR